MTDPDPVKDALKAVDPSRDEAIRHALEFGKEAGRVEERNKATAWIRDNSPGPVGMSIAHALNRKEHWEEPDGNLPPP